MKAVLIGLITLPIGLGVGFASGTAVMFADHPAIIVETKWKTVTTAPPVQYEAETPFHVDPKVICEDTTTTTTTIPAPVPTPVPPAPTTTTITLPPSTLPPSSTTSTTLIPTTTTLRPTTSTTEAPH